MQVGSMVKARRAQVKADESRRKQMKANERLRARKNESKLAHGWLINSGNQTKFKLFSPDNYDLKQALVLYRLLKRLFNSIGPLL